MLNKVILMGRLTKEPELRYTTTNNTPVCTFTLAVNRRYKQDGQQQADFINCIAWGKIAEFCSNYYHKGQQVAVVGRIQTITWEDNESKRHYVTEVVCEETYFADSKREQPGDALEPQNQVPPELLPDEDDLPF